MEASLETSGGSLLGESFYERQARYMGEILKADPAFLIKRTEALIYRGWEPLFRKVKLFPHALETLKAFREREIKLGLLSDFPPETKLEFLGLPGLWDAVLCSETVGRLKPDPLPFRKLAEAMGLPPEKILYVGNSFSYDVEGAQSAGMKAAWVCTWKKPGTAWAERARRADFVFFDYRQLRDYVLP
jgi:putative hydrolase of the HAD superfamily